MDIMTGSSLQLYFSKPPLLTEECLGTEDIVQWCRNDPARARPWLEFQEQKH